MTVELHLFLMAAMLVLALAIGALVGWLIRDFIAHCDAVEQLHRDSE